MRQKLSKISQNRNNLHKKWTQIIVYGFSKNNKFKKTLNLELDHFYSLRKHSEFMCRIFP